MFACVSACVCARTCVCSMSTHTRESPVLSLEEGLGTLPLRVTHCALIMRLSEERERMEIC